MPPEAVGHDDRVPHLSRGSISLLALLLALRQKINSIVSECSGSIIVATVVLQHLIALQYYFNNFGDLLVLDVALW